MTLTLAGNDALIVALQNELLDHAGQVHGYLSRGHVRRLVRNINRLRAANGWQPLNLAGRS